MKIVLTALSNDAFAESKKQLIESAKTNANIEGHPYDFEDIKSTRFYEDNFHILQAKKGLGYWLWKPYIILQELLKLDNGDVLVYSD